MERAEGGRRGGGGGREEGDTTTEAVSHGGSRKERGAIWVVSKGWRRDPLHLLTGRPRKRQRRGSWESSNGLGRGLSSSGGEPPGLLCFKTGIKRYRSGSHAEFLASGEGSEAQTWREIERVLHFFSFNKASRAQRERRSQK